MPKTSSPAKAAAARINGCRGGTKSPNISRANALKHGLFANTLMSSLREGRHLPEYPQYAALFHAVVADLCPSRILEYLMIDKFVMDKWILDRANRFLLSETERAGNGMDSPALQNVQYHLRAANAQFANDFNMLWKNMRGRRRVAAAMGPDAGAVDHGAGADRAVSGGEVSGSVAAGGSCPSGESVVPSPSAAAAGAAESPDRGDHAPAAETASAGAGTGQPSACAAPSPPADDGELGPEINAG